MDVNLARTFLIVAETGSFIDAARKLNITQSTVSARIKGLEELLGRPLFTRSKSGAELTGAGELFQKHALALVRVWQQAQLQVSLADQHPEHISVGAPLSLWSGFLLKWASRPQSADPGHRRFGDGRRVGDAEPAFDRWNARSRGHVSAVTAPGPHDRAPIR